MCYNKLQRNVQLNMGKKFHCMANALLKCHSLKKNSQVLKNNPTKNCAYA